MYVKKSTVTTTNTNDNHSYRRVLVPIEKVGGKRHLVITYDRNNI